MSTILFRDVELRTGCRADVLVTGGRVSAIGGWLSARRADLVIDGAGGALLPGLCDHHLHLIAAAAWHASVPCGPPAVRDRAELAAALRLAAEPKEAASRSSGWIRGVGYVETVAGDLDAARLDELVPDRPVRIQHRSGALWVLNTAALQAIGAACADQPGIERDGGGRPTGRLWRADAWLRTRLPPGEPPDLARLGRRLARLGITAVTDATPGLDMTALTALSAASADGALPQRLHLLGAPAGFPDAPRVTVGPYKIVIAESGLPGLAELTARIRELHAYHRPVAVHCVTREALLLFLAAHEEAGGLPGDRIEHASLVPPEAIPVLARRGLRVVTQPGFLAARGDDYLRDVPVTDHGDLYRCASLQAAGVRVALSSDAPYGPLDPWQVMTAAAGRRTPADLVVGEAECMTPEAALDSYLTPPGDPGGRPRRITIGGPADLVLLHAPRAEALRQPDATAVRATLVDGDLIEH